MYAAAAATLGRQRGLRWRAPWAAAWAAVLAAAIDGDGGGAGHGNEGDTVVLPRRKTLPSFGSHLITRPRLALEASGMAESESTFNFGSRNDLLMFLTEFDRPD